MTDFNVINGDKISVLNALHSPMTDIEDPLIYYTGIQHGMDYLISYDKKFINAAIPALAVCTPEEFLRRMG